MKKIIKIALLAGILGLTIQQPLQAQLTRLAEIADALKDKIIFDKKSLLVGAILGGGALALFSMYADDVNDAAHNGVEATTAFLKYCAYCAGIAGVGAGLLVGPYLARHGKSDLSQWCGIITAMGSAFGAGYLYRR